MKLYAIVVTSRLDFDELADELYDRGVKPLFMTNSLKHEARDIEAPDFDVTVRSHNRTLEHEEASS